MAVYLHRNNGKVILLVCTMTIIIKIIVIFAAVTPSARSSRRECNDLVGTLFPARLHASADTSHGPVSVCLSVCLSVSDCLSQVGVLLKRLNESGWFLASTYPTHPPGTLLKILYLENFATAYRSSRRAINLTGRSEREKLDRRRSTKLTIPPSSDARPL